MVGGAKYYIIFNYFKYILISILIFIGLIWISQILRILDLQHTISVQILDVLKTTLLVLPSFISPLSSFLLLLASFSLNYKLRSNNEIIILKQYLKLNQITLIFSLIFIILFSINFLNKEYFSIKAYHKYKIEELEIRNNLKLGTPTEKEFYIEDELNIFFKSSDNGVFFDVEALIFNNSQLVKAKYAEVETSKKRFNIIFFQGERLSLNDEEITKTNFEKFIYTINNKETEKLLFDREHFNTNELINHSDIKFKVQGHNRIYQYFVNIIILFISLKIIFLYKPKQKLIKKFAIIFIMLMIIQIINSYLIYLFNNFQIKYYGYYLINFIALIIFNFMTRRLIK